MFMRIIIRIIIRINMRMRMLMSLSIHMFMRISMRSFRLITPPVASRMRSVIKISPFYFCDFFIDI